MPAQAAPEPASLEEGTAPQDRIRQWLTAHIGRVIALAPLPGWRPTWNATVETATGPIGIHIRSDRAAGLETQPLRREHDVLRLLERHGIPVPHIHGWCEDPEAIVMDRIDAIPFLGGAHVDPALHRLVSDYIAIMARIHRIDTAEAVAIGLSHPATPDDIAFAYFGDNDRHFLAHRSGPQPLIEFVRKWIGANIPRHRTQTALIVADAPQFFHDGTQVTQIYDLELAHIGDPMADLASVRVRDINEPFGGMTVLLQRYVSESGRPIDWAALDFHTIANFISVPMRVGSILETQADVPAYVEYLSWYLACARAAIEVLADVRQVTLDEVPAIAPVETPNRLIYANLVASCADLPPATGRLREPQTLSIARYLQRLDSIGGEIARLEQTEAEALLGATFATAQDTEAALERFVIDAGPDQDAALIGLFHRRMMRRLQLIGDYPAPIVDRGPSPVDRAAVDSVAVEKARA